MSGQDHQPAIANIKLHLKAKPKPAKVTKYDIQKLKDVHISELYAFKIGGRFGPLLDLPDTDLDVEGMWEEIKSSIGDTSQKILGNKKPKPQKPWLSSEVLLLCDERGQLKQEKDSNTTKRRRYNYTAIFLQTSRYRHVSVTVWETRHIKTIRPVQNRG